MRPCSRKHVQRCPFGTVHSSRQKKESNANVHKQWDGCKQNDEFTQWNTTQQCKWTHHSYTQQHGRISQVDCWVESTCHKNTLSGVPAVLSSKSGNLLLKATYMGGHVIKKRGEMIIRKVRIAVTSGRGGTRAHCGMQGTVCFFIGSCLSGLSLP